MESVQSTWKFCRNEPESGRAPIPLDALHALQDWRRGHPRRAYQDRAQHPVRATSTSWSQGWP